MKSSHGMAYVVAENPNEAYMLLRNDLDQRDLGISHEREMETVELIAEQIDYPDCKIKLYT